MPLIELETIRYQYPGAASRLVLDGVSLSLEEGQRVALQGTSGSGKSTLLAIMGLLMPPTEGRRVFRGRDTSALEPEDVDRLRSEEIGFVFQHHFLMAELSALENVALPAHIKSGHTGRLDYERAEKLLSRLGMADKSASHPRQLSGGEQQRVAIARALINGPSLVLADEPTGNLDSASGAKVLNLFQDLTAHEGCTLLLATHDDRVASTCDRCLIIRDGCLVEERGSEER